MQPSKSWIAARVSGQLLLLMGLLAFSACSNLPFVKQNKAPSRIFVADFSTAWTAALEAVSNGKDVIKSQNRETGVIETNWIDNSESRQFLDVFTNEDFFLRSRYKIQVHIREGKKNGQQAVLVRVIKHSQRESTFLGGFQDVESDLLEESVYLYRIGRLIAIQQASDEEDMRADSIHDEGETLF